jgi:hypothetical protein
MYWLLNSEHLFVENIGNKNQARKEKGSTTMSFRPCVCVCVCASMKRRTTLEYSPLSLHPTKRRRFDSSLITQYTHQHHPCHHGTSRVDTLHDLSFSEQEPSSSLSHYVEETNNHCLYTFQSTDNNINNLPKEVLGFIFGFFNVKELFLYVSLSLFSLSLSRVSSMTPPSDLHLFFLSLPSVHFLCSFVSFKSCELPEIWLLGLIVPELFPN